ncbi:hypothetical protein GIS00_25255 [Nakamurella sp. YIM 132087]|uniref:TPM domain-containing protein n=1 Tax=Nakamurella alba TaxID=2665158 RepID=A0A7K1FVL0_9ACTN|nr:hypothetical protein [Nakamurella alba]MTD17243.1 hypothetical protein [Nakamurella alba]
MNRRNPTKKRTTVELSKPGRPGTGKGRPVPLSVGLAARLSPRRPRRMLLLVLVALLAGWTWAFWPRLTLPFSEAANAVEVLDSSVVYDQGTLDQEQRAGVAGAVGTRPLMLAFLAGDDTDAGDFCSAVVERIDGVILLVIQDGEFAYECWSEDLPYTDDSWVAFDAYLSRSLDLSTRYLDDRPVDIARTAALQYDSMVRSGRLVAGEREFRAPVGATLAGVGVALGVVAGVVLVVVGIRALALVAVSSRARTEALRRRREDLQDVLDELALVVVGAAPADPRRTAMQPWAAGTAAGYADLAHRMGAAGEDGLADLTREAKALLDAAQWGADGDDDEDDAHGRGKGASR